MTRKKHNHPVQQRLFVAVVALAFCYSRHDRIDGFRWPLLAAAADADADVLSSAAPPSPLTSSAHTPSATASTSTESLLDRTSNFFSKFDSYGPTLTLTLRDPSRMALISGGAGNSDRRTKLWKSGSSRSRANADTTSKAQLMSDDRGFGITSKVAALFHISSAASTTNGEVSSSPKKSQFADGYMLDDGEIFLEPPSSSTENSSTSRGLFSIRDFGSGILGGGWGSRPLSECAQNVHPEMKHEIISNTTPFPKSAPWLSGLTCGMVWSPFPVYKAGYPDGYGHKLLSAPHFIRCGTRLSLPRISTMIRSWRSTSRGVSRTFEVESNDRPTTKDLDLGVTYRESPSRPGGTLELLLGRSRGYLPAPDVNMGEPSTALLQSTADEYHRRNNHILVRLATGRDDNKKTMISSNSNQQNPILASIEYAKGSFRLPTPWFLRTRYNDRLSVSPSFDFVEGTAHCVFSGDVGTSGRTRAVLRLDSEADSTLTVVRALDESKIIAPTISLNSGKIVYDYYLNLDGISGKQGESHRKVNSSIRAHVDPTKGILLKWTDGIHGRRNGGSCWVTECRVPLGTTAAGPLAADIRVGRRWSI